jgi:ABC-type glycerol-3-phosphate transport system permease component
VLPGQLFLLIMCVLFASPQYFLFIKSLNVTRNVINNESSARAPTKQKSALLSSSGVWTNSAECYNTHSLWQRKSPKCTNNSVSARAASLAASFLPTPCLYLLSTKITLCSVNARGNVWMDLSLYLSCAQ